MVPVINSPHPGVEIPEVSVADLVLAAARERADRAAMVDAATGRTITYEQLAAGVRQVAEGLAVRGFAKGEVFGIYAPNLPEYPVVFLGVAAAGGVVTTVNPTYTVEELSAQLTDAGARFLLTVPALCDRAVEAARRSGIEDVFVIGDAPGGAATPFADLLADPERTSATAVAIDPARDLVALPYSSGTTGSAKGVMLTHRNMVAILAELRGVATLGPDDRVIAVLPFFHIYGLSVLLGFSLSRGATVVSLPRFDLEAFLQALQQYRITLAYVVPPIVLALAKHPLVDRYDLSALRLVMSGAAPLDPDLQRVCAERIGCPVVQGYGLTETSVGVAGNEASPLGVRAGSAGVLLPNTQARIVDPATDQDLDVGQAGELWVHGPQVMVGYHHAPQATDLALTPDGWLRTGDLCRFDADGYLYVVDRIKELIKYKGYQVAPAELEAVLLTHPTITDAAVVPSPDPEAGEVPKAFVVTTEPLDADSLLAWVADRVAPYKKIRRIEFIDQIPKSPSGKILRRHLRDQERIRTR
jgi:acyl-CoA synthetase (AMP-forming)/AMP-acid ligase II